MNIEKIDNLDAAIVKSKLLVADPYMNESQFKRAVVLLCEHNNETGTLGFILNKNLNIKLNDLIASFPDFDTNVHYGGPVSTDTIHYVHNVGDLLPESIRITNGLYWGGDFEQMKTLIATDIIKPENVRFFLGYSGWGAGQLQEEMRNHSWLLANLHANFVFKSKGNSKLWETVLSKESGVFDVLAQIPSDLSWN
ncbi:MAG: YqgE/AlgH family protein [Saprospiraceae bacterium]